MDAHIWEVAEKLMAAALKEGRVASLATDDEEAVRAALIEAVAKLEGTDDFRADVSSALDQMF